MSRNRIGGIAGSLVVGLGIVGLLCGTVAHGQSTGKTTNRAGGWPKGEKITYPAEGRVTANRVRVRAGSSLNYYVCGVLSRDSKVVVHEEGSGWLKIDPPKGLPFNQTLPPDETVAYIATSEEALPATVSCSIHPWMRARPLRKMISSGSVRSSPPSTRWFSRVS